MGGDLPSVAVPTKNGVRFTFGEDVSEPDPVLHISNLNSRVMNFTERLRGMKPAAKAKNGVRFTFGEDVSEPDPVLALFYKPHPGAAVLVVMKYCFFSTLIFVAILQLAGLIVNVSRGYVNTLRMYKFVEIRYDSSPSLFFFGVAWELALWILPMYAILKFLNESN